MIQRKIYHILKKIKNEFMPTSASRPMTRYLKENYKRPLTGAEIGVRYGDNALNLLKVLPIKKLYLIDPYEIYSEFKEQAKKEEIKNINKIFEICKNKLKKYSEKIEFIKKISSESIDDITIDLDFVYIDGNHQYEYVKKDIELYYPKIKNGGVIGGHDFYPDCIGVVEASIEFAKKKNLRLYGQKADWWIVKKK